MTNICYLRNWNLGELKMKRILSFAFVALVVLGWIFFTAPTQSGEEERNPQAPISQSDLVVCRKYVLKTHHPFILNEKVLTFVGWNKEGNPVFQDFLRNELTIFLGSPGAPEIKEYKPILK